MKNTRAVYCVWSSAVKTCSTLERDQATVPLHLKDKAPSFQDREDACRWFKGGGKEAISDQVENHSFNRDGGVPLQCSMLPS